MTTETNECTGTGTKPWPMVFVPIMLNRHKVNPANDLISVAALDSPAKGGAHHNYGIYWPSDNAVKTLGIGFQKGAINEEGVNGVTHEILLAIVEHRLLCFQNGPYACEENAKALEHVAAALDVLKERTLKRIARGVEGTMQK